MKRHDQQMREAYARVAGRSRDVLQAWAGHRDLTPSLVALGRAMDHLDRTFGVWPDPKYAPDPSPESIASHVASTERCIDAAAPGAWHDNSKGGGR